MMECNQEVSPDGTRLGGIRSVGIRKAILSYPTESIYIPHKIESRLDAVVKSSFPTDDAIGYKLGMFGYFELSSTKVIGSY